MRLLAAITLACLLADCSGPGQPEPECTDPECACLQAGCPPEQECFGGLCLFPCTSHHACTFGHDIPVGYCQAGGCTSMAGCQLDGCPDGQACQGGTVCDDTDCRWDWTCEDPATTCARDTVAPCVCHIVNGSGAIAAESSSIVLGPQERLSAAVLLLGSDRLVASTEFDMSLTGASTPGEATLIATLPGADPEVTCSARIINPGSAGADFEIVVMDVATGAPVASAFAVIDSDGDGTDDGGAPATDSAGFTAASAATVSGSDVDVTVFGPTHSPSSVLAIKSPVDLYTFVAPRPAPVRAQRIVGPTGGFVNAGARQVLFEGWYGVLGVASNVLSELAFFADDTLVQGRDVDCNAPPPPPNCVLVNGTGPYVLPRNLSWQGVGMSSDGFIAAAPGISVVWVLATLQTLEAYSWALSAFGACTCDTTRRCDPACECDVDCPETPERASFAAALWLTQNQLLYSGAVAGAVTLNAGAEPVSMAPYPILRPLDLLSEIPVPDLPLDPARSGDVLQQLIVMSGSNVPGAGFVPTGFGVGLACEIGGEPCPTGTVTDPRVKPGFECVVKYPLRSGCPSYVPARPAPGRVILQYTPPHDGLEGWPEVMVAIALPDKSRMYADDHRVAGLIVHRAPIRDYDDAFEDATYPSFPVLPTTYVPREYELRADTTFDMHWVILGDDPDDPTVPRWEIFAPADVDRTFIAPVPPPGIDDLFDGTRPIHIRHTGLRLLPGRDLQSLAASGDLTPGKLFDHVSAFATRRGVLAP